MKNTNIIRMNAETTKKISLFAAIVTCIVLAINI
jgi:hypothetical protein